MGRAGDYNVKLLWLKAEPNTNPANGATEYVHVPSGYLWCAVEEVAGRRETEHNAPQHGSQAILRIRNYPELYPMDLLKDEDYEYVWRIDTFYNGNNEIVCDAWRNNVVDYIIEDS